MTKPMTEQEAVEVLKRDAKYNMERTQTGRVPHQKPPSFPEVRAALAALEGKVLVDWNGGETYYRLVQANNGEWNVHLFTRPKPSPDCFPTREEAEAECKRRNEKGDDRRE